MELNLERMNDVAIVRIKSEAIDASNIQEFKEKISVPVDQTKNLVFDMEEVLFVDSSGCGALLSCLRKIKEKHGRLILCNTKTQVKHLFSLIHMDRIFKIYNDCEEAIKYLMEQEPLS